MSYLSLARKYRPKSFCDLVGQEPTALALSNSIKMQRAPSAVMFSGVRGIGKTTTARLYAKALNCEKGPTEDPCGLCASCAAIASGRHEDVLEIDGASNNGVDEIRALQETVSYVPQRSSYKIYIIDEVHMLSLSAFNALLKTLEEPPQHVVFILATTELHKVPDTVVGRCQVFHLRKLSIEDTKRRVRSILELENLPFDEESLNLVASEGKGSMRDALTFLDQAIALCAGGLKADELKTHFQSSSIEQLCALLKSLLRRDVKAVLDAVAAFESSGLEAVRLLEDLAKCVRHAFIFKQVGSEHFKKAELTLSSVELSFLEQIVAAADGYELHQLFRTLVECRRDLDGSELDRFLAENYLVEWCIDPGFPSVDLYQVEGAKGQQFNEMRPVQPRPEAGETTIRASLSGAAVTDRQAQVHEKKKVSLTDAFKASVSEDGELQKKKIESSLKEQSSKDENKKQAFEQTKSSWQRLLAKLKVKKPLMALLLEEAYPIKISKDSVEIAIKEGSMAWNRLIENQQQQLLLKNLRDLFNYQGRFSIVPFQAEVHRGLNLFEDKQTARETEMAQNKHDALTGPMTAALVSVFSGDVEAIEGHAP